MQRLLKSLAWKLFPHADFQIEVSEGLKVAIQSRADFIAYKEIFVDQIYKDFLEQIGPIPSWVDLGSNCGFFSLYAEMLFRKMGDHSQRKAVLVDPNSHAQKSAKKTIELNDLISEFTRMEAAVAGKEEFVNYYESKATYRSSLYNHYKDAKQKRVSCIALDEIVGLLSAPPMLLKMDIEGAELTVIENWSKVIKDIPYLLIEWHAPRAYFGLINQKMTSLGFSLSQRINCTDEVDENGDAKIGVGLWQKEIV